MSGRTRLVPWLVLATLVASCHRKPEATVATAEAPPAQAASKAAPDSLAASVAAVAVGTTALPLTIRFEVPVAPHVDQPAKLTLTLTADQPLERVEIDGSSAALLIDAATQKQFLDALEPGKPRQIDLGFTSRSLGLSDVELEVRVITGKESLQSSFAIPVLTVAPAAPATGG
ncbi:MAG: hypothetical protein RL030_2201 [Pseudomonadota bacterium]|jgi:hypothetical protein